MKIENIKQTFVDKLKGSGDVLVAIHYADDEILNLVLSEAKTIELSKQIDEKILVI